MFQAFQVNEMVNTMSLENLFKFRFDRSKLPFVRFFTEVRNTSAIFQCCSEDSGTVPDGLSGPQMAQTKLFLCRDEVRTHFGVV